MDNLNDDDKINFLEILCKTYSNLPKDPNTIKILPIPENASDIDSNNKNDVLLFIFEMLLEFYLEGIMHYKDIFNLIQAKITHNYENINQEEIESRFINGEYDEFNIDDINLDILEINKEYLASIGYFLRIYEYNEKDDEDFTPDNYYCKIILKNNPADYGYFYLRNINLPYHIVLNGNFIKAILKVNDKTFVISFEELSNILTNTNNHTCRN